MVEEDAIVISLLQSIRFDGYYRLTVVSAKPGSNQDEHIFGAKPRLNLALYISVDISTSSM